MSGTEPQERLGEAAGPSTTSTSAPPTHPEETANARNKANHRTLWPYGNYRSYYFFRPAASSSANSALPADTLDGRLALLDCRLFAEKRLLDIGTNSGKVAFDALRHMGATSVVGVDIDPLLIEDAWRIAGELGYEKGDDRLDFLVTNVMDDGWLEAFVASGNRRVDVITLFSITKWLHLHHGDAGMTRLFQSLYRVLPVGGLVMIEPQEWDNYKRAVKRNKDLRETFKAIKLRPPFEDEMREAGFKLEQRIEREEGGFSRPLLVWRKVG
ncbi:ribosomal L11 methyltransferase, PrmA [Rhodotorula toruloides]|uniref:RNA methyltransferase n=1 Tax=Rhodotorula toruloides TaxID=5286 RepID=A0A511KNN0_RHOTO|nr:ribosomal L11 methyltransferase, PrmA [Rhodotorula toruloides]